MTGAASGIAAIGLCVIALPLALYFTLREDSPGIVGGCGQIGALDRPPPHLAA